jgi:hypothetical protein
MVIHMMVYKISIFKVIGLVVWDMDMENINGV